jgi:hypothetical protein
MAIWYCSPAGAGTKSGASEANAKAGLFESVALMGVGDTLKVLPGTYSYNNSLRTIANSGSSGSYKTIEAHNPASRPLIKATAAFASSWMQINNIDWTEPDGGTGGSHTYQLRGTEGARFDGCTFSNTRGYAIMQMPGSSPNEDWRFDNCTFGNNHGYSGHNDVQDHLVYCVARQTDGVFSHCIFHDSPRGRGIKFGPSGGSAPAGGVTVEYCTFDNNPGYANITFTGTMYDVTIHRCILSRGGNHNAGNQQQTGAPTNCILSDSYLYSPGTYASGMFNTVSGVVVGGDPAFDSEYVPSNSAAVPYGAYASGGSPPPPVDGGGEEEPPPDPVDPGGGGEPPPEGGAGGAYTIRQTLDFLATPSTTLGSLPDVIKFLWRHEVEVSRLWGASGDTLYLSVDGGTSFTTRGTPSPGNDINWVVEAFDNIGTLDVLAGKNVYTSFDNGATFALVLEGPVGSTARCYASGFDRHWVGFTDVEDPASPLRATEGGTAAFPPDADPPVTSVRALTMLVEEPIMYAFDAEGRIWKLDVDDGGNAEHVADMPDA